MSIFLDQVSSLLRLGLHRLVLDKSRLTLWLDLASLLFQVSAFSYFLSPIFWGVCVTFFFARVVQSTLLVLAILLVFFSCSVVADMPRMEKRGLKEEVGHLYHLR